MFLRGGNRAVPADESAWVLSDPRCGVPPDGRAALLLCPRTRSRPDGCPTFPVRRAAFHSAARSPSRMRACSLPDPPPEWTAQTVTGPPDGACGFSSPPAAWRGIPRAAARRRSRPARRLPECPPDRPARLHSRSCFRPPRRFRRPDAPVGKARAARCATGNPAAAGRSCRETGACRGLPSGCTGCVL